MDFIGFISYADFGSMVPLVVVIEIVFGLIEAVSNTIESRFDFTVKYLKEVFICCPQLIIGTKNNMQKKIFFRMENRINHKFFKWFIV